MKLLVLNKGILDFFILKSLIPSSGYYLTHVARRNIAVSLVGVSVLHFFILLCKNVFIFFLIVYS